MRYRNIFFKDNIIQNGIGYIEVEYYGVMYSNADTMIEFKSLYDPKKDLYISCSKCAKNKYKSFKKVSK